jgi:3-oxoacyl-[acyl-carrier-protein] synthase II
MIGDVVITGAGCLAAHAPSVAALANAAASGAGPIGPAFLPQPLPRPATWGVRPPRLGRMDRYTQVALLAAHEAFVDAGLHREPQDPQGLGVVLGTGYGCHETDEEYYRGILAGGAGEASPRLFAATLPSTPAGEIAILLSAEGPSLTLAQGWDAGLAAVAEAARLCHRGAAEVVLAGGVDVLTPTLLRLLAAWGHEQGAAEGAAFLVVERADHAARRARPPLARIRGAGAAFSPAPSRRPPELAACRAALADGASPPDVVSHIVEAIAEDPRRSLAALGITAPCLELRGVLGRTFGASGPLAVAVAALTLAGPTLVYATDPQGSSTALLLDPAPRRAPAAASPPA